MQSFPLIYPVMQWWHTLPLISPAMFLRGSLKALLSLTRSSGPSDSLYTRVITPLRTAEGSFRGTMTSAWGAERALVAGLSMSLLSPLRSSSFFQKLSTSCKEPMVPLSNYTLPEHFAHTTKVFSTELPLHRTRVLLRSTQYSPEAYVMTSFASSVCAPSLYFRYQYNPSHLCLNNATKHHVGMLALELDTEFLDLQLDHRTLLEVHLEGQSAHDSAAVLACVQRQVVRLRCGCQRQHVYLCEVDLG